MSPRDVGRVYGAGRVAIGALLVLAPRALLRPLLGRSAATPAAAVLARATGARDVVIGLIALHTLDHPEVGPRWQRTSGAVDAADAVAVLAARRALPSVGSAVFVAVAAGGAATGAWVARGLAGQDPSA